ncbi:MAG: ABC transporter permease [Lachnospiraceae bacterium]|nr:ABC transporter permease [Lachnospiraceae bacterium]
MDLLYFLIQQTLLFMIPLLIVALGGMFSERAGVVNIALEGIMVMGAFTSIFFINLTQGFMSGNGQLLIAILIAAATGIVFSLFHAIASVNLKADQTISGTALNMFAPAFAIFIARIIQTVQQIEFKNTFRIVEVPILSKIPIIGEMLFKNSYITTYIGILILILSSLVLYKTKFGLRLRACGENPHAANTAGIKVELIQYAGVLISGALAGIGGLVFVVPTSTNFNATVSGYGFLAVAVLIFGQWKPKYILFASFFFGFMKALSNSYASIPFLFALNIQSNIYKMIPYIATILVLIFTSKKSAAPRASGIPFDKMKR